MKRLLVLLALAGCASPGGAGPAAAPAAPPAIDGERLLQHVRVLADDSMAGRRAGTPGSAKARRYLVAELQRMGVQPVGASFEHPFTFRGRRDSTAVQQGVNLLGRITGTRHPERFIVLSAHYDHVGVGRAVQGDSIYNGADDNASGTAALLEIAAHLRRNPPAATVIIALLDAEEVGLRGAQAFVEAPPVPRDAIVLNVNLDMVSHSARGELYAAGAAHYPFLRPFLETVAARAPIRLLLGHDRPVPTAQDDWTFQSDHGAFHRAGIPFLYFGVEDHPDYHQPSDEFDSITPEFYVGAVRTILDALRVLDQNLAQIQQARAGG